MAKAKKKQQTGLITWEDVDATLRRMGELEIAISRIEGNMTLRINEIKAEAEAKAEGLKAERKQLEAEVTGFCEAHKDEFAKVRTKELTFGLVGYRVVSKIVIRSKRAAIAAMKALGLTGYLRIKEEPDKEAMESLDDVTLARIGIVRKVEDKIRIEPNQEKIRDTAPREAA